MKKLFLLVAVITVLFVSCGKKSKTFKVGATVPAVDILNNLKDDFKKAGINLEVVEFTDYVTPNIALAEKQIDANFFQHKPYLDFFKKSKNLDLKALDSIIISPIGIYSKKISDINNIKNGTVIGIPNDATNLARALLVLQDTGLIKLDKSKGLNLTTSDITYNPKNLKFKEVEAAMLPRLLDDLDVTFINGNYAISSGLNPSKDSIYREKLNSPYANIIAVRTGDENLDTVKKLIEILKSDKDKEFINKTYNGGILPTF